MSDADAGQNKLHVPQIPNVDSNLQHEIDEAIGDQSVDDLMAQSETPPAEPATGQPRQDGDESPPPDEDPIGFELRRGRISRIDGDDVFIDLMGIDSKLQGIVPLKQFERPPRQGSIMDFVLERVDESEGLMHLSREGAVTFSAWDQLRKGANVEAHVVATNKGGLELELAGRIRAFMPASLVDLHHVDDMEQFVGQKLTCSVQEVRHRAKRVILNRRHYLEHQRERQRQKLLKELESGQTRSGTITSIVPFGAFVDLGGLDGLIHISDLSYSRVSKPQDVVQVGQQVTVKVLKIEEDGQRIRLGLKQFEPDPWMDVSEKYHPGDQVSGRVVRITNFGVFVEIGAGIEGLVPVSELSWKHISNPGAICKEGDVLKLAVLKIGQDKRRISLSLKQVQGDPWRDAGSKYAKNTIVDGTVVRTTEFGAFVELETGVEGLAHISELADHRVERVEDVLKVGDKQQFRVLAVNDTDRKVSLSVKAIKNPPQEPTSDSQQPAKAPQQPKCKKPSKPLKSGLGEHGGMGQGLGNLKL